MAVLTPDPATRDQLAYARLIIREALRHGGQGWLDYDRAFRQQVAADPSMRWNTLLPGLQAATILGRGGGQGLAFCTLCRGSDHTRSQCALLYLQPPASRPPLPPLLQLPGADSTIFVCPGIGERVSFQTTVHTDMCVLLANCHTRLKIAPGQPKALRLSSSAPQHTNHSP